MADEKMTQNEVVDAKQAAKELQELHRLEQVRLEKLQELQAAGRDPFEIVTYDQTEHSADIKDNYEQYAENLKFCPGRHHADLRCDLYRQT